MSTPLRSTKNGNARYGIYRIDSDQYRQHAWRVKLVRRGEIYIKNFTDKRYGGKLRALREAKGYRNKILRDFPPLSRKEFCSILRRNNRSGVSGVYKYAKKHYLKNGRAVEAWYWEATWPNERGGQFHQSFSVNEFGEAGAKKMALAARQEALDSIVGDYWASSRGMA